MRFGNLPKGRWAAMATMLMFFKSSFRLLAGGGTEVKIPRWMERRMSYAPNGAQERARRVRQIDAGTLRPSNGLVFRQLDGGELRANSHGYGMVMGIRTNLR